MQGKDGSSEMRLIRVDRSVARVPQLAIHLNREVNDGLKLNRERHMSPVVGLEGGGVDALSFIAAELDVAPEAILGHDLMLFDVVPPCFSGFADEFIHAPRLDNLASCHAGLSALLAAADKETDRTRVIAFYDHEEVGSSTLEGAAGSFLGDVAERLAGSNENMVRAQTKVAAPLRRHGPRRPPQLQRPT